MAEIEQLRFLTPALAFEVEKTVGTPAFVYDYSTLKSQVRLGGGGLCFCVRDAHSRGRRQAHPPAAHGALRP